MNTTQQLIMPAATGDSLFGRNSAHTISWNWWPTQFVPVWHWKFNMDRCDCCRGAACFDDLHWAKTATYTYNQAYSFKPVTEKRGKKIFKKYTIKLVVMPEARSLSHVVNSIVWQVANCHMWAGSAWQSQKPCQNSPESIRLHQKFKLFWGMPPSPPQWKGRPPSHALSPCTRGLQPT